MAIRKNTPTVLPVRDLHRLIDGITDYSERIYEAAKWYAHHRIMIIPFTKGGYPKGLSQHHATASLEKIESWWHPQRGIYAGASIAMAHGGASGFVAVDIDVKKNDGLAVLADLAHAYSRDDDDLATLMQATPSGGRHLVFQFHPEIISNSEVAYEGIDTRGGVKGNPANNGGVTFIEPSMKPDGSGYYRWDEGITEIRQIPQWLVDILNKRMPQTGEIKLQDAYIESQAGTHGEGRDRNIYIDLLRFVGAGYTEEQIRALKPEILARMQPPDEAMVDKKIESALNSDAFKKAKERKETQEVLTSLPFVRDSKERILRCVENLEIILTSATFEYEYGLIEYDDFTQNFIRNKKPLASLVDWSVGVQGWIAKKFKLDFNKTDIRDRMEYIAYNKPHANIAREYFMMCKDKNMPVGQKENYWGSGRLSGGRAFERLCNEVLDLNNPNLHPHYTEDTREAYKGFLWFWLQGVCARACVPACKMEIVLNIFGEQGIGKSLFFRNLCPDPKWFTDSLQDSIVGGGQNNRDELLKLHAKIIVEMPELNPIKRGGKSADDKLKQFISAQVDNFRRAYGHDSVDHPRTCALAGTSNNRDVYRDSTGARRFVSIDHGSRHIRVGDKDTGVMEQIRDELWGEVAHSFCNGELDLPSNRLLVAIPPALRDSQKDINERHRYEEIGINDVIDWMADKTRLAWNDILSYTNTVAGLRDTKEAIIMTQLRKELSNNPNWEFKKRVTYNTADGKKDKANCWININHPAELAGEVVQHYAYRPKEEDRY